MVTFLNDTERNRDIWILGEYIWNCNVTLVGNCFVRLWPLPWEHTDAVMADKQWAGTDSDLNTTCLRLTLVGALPKQIKHWIDRHWLVCPCSVANCNSKPEVHPPTVFDHNHQRWAFDALNFWFLTVGMSPYVEIWLARYWNECHFSCHMTSRACACMH